MNGIEQRKSTRITERAPVAFSYLPDVTVQAGTIDLSRGGALLDSPVSLKPGRNMNLSIKIGTFQLDPVVATVRRSRPVFWGSRYLVAVEFEHENHSVVEALEFQAVAG